MNNILQRDLDIELSESKTSLDHSGPKGKRHLYSVRSTLIQQFVIWNTPKDSFLIGFFYYTLLKLFALFIYYIQASYIHSFSSSCIQIFGSVLHGISFLEQPQTIQLTQAFNKVSKAALPNYILDRMGLNIDGKKLSVSGSKLPNTAL